jgi:hypothetical protein
MIGVNTAWLPYPLKLSTRRTGARSSELLYLS